MKGTDNEIAKFQGDYELQTIMNTASLIFAPL